jgi:O-antigen/teichoic acid export membrane protein
MSVWNWLKSIISDYRDLSTLGVANLLSSLIQAFFWFLVAAIVETESYGQIGYYIAIASIVTVIATPGVSNTIVVQGSKNAKIKPPLFLLSIILITISSAALFFILNDAPTSLYFLGFAMFSLLVAELLSRKLFAVFFKIMIIQRTLSIIIALSLYYTIGIDGIILGLAISYLVYMPKVIVVLKQGALDLSALGTYKGFMLNNFGYDFSRILTTQLDKMVIFPLFGFITLGNYYLAIQFLAIGSIIPGTVYQYLLPQETKERSFKNLKVATIGITALLAVAVFVLAPVLLPVIFPHFEDVVSMVQIMILSIIPQTINNMYITKLLTTGRSRTVFVGSSIFLITQITGIIILGIHMSIYGIAIALFVGHIAELIFLTVSNRYSNRQITT